MTMLGKKHSLETRQKIRNALRGRKLSPQHCQKMREARRGKCRGEKNNNWKGGRRYNNGYILIYSPDHPRANKQGYVFEHRLIMEESLGRYLESWEVVHHKNRIRDDNGLENLQLLPKQSEHLSLQKMQAELQAQKQKTRKWTEGYFRLLTVQERIGGRTATTGLASAKRGRVYRAAHQR